MNTPTKLLAFAAALTAVFGLAFGVGRVADPDTAPAAAHGDEGHGGTHESEADPAETGPVRLALTRRELSPGRAVPVSFQVQDAAGEPVTAYDVEHEEELHLIVLDTRSLTDYQHVHPTRTSDGTWTTTLRLAPGTSYRVYADGSTAGTGFLATADIHTTGRHPAPWPLPEPAVTAHVDGFEVELDEHDGEATLRVTRGGQPATLEPYLGALGHLVVIRVDDLAYLHVHPEDGAQPVFAVSGLAPGSYRYFFDFQVDGVVRTASFTVESEGSDEHGH